LVKPEQKSEACMAARNRADIASANWFSSCAAAPKLSDPRQPI
jgi:hypothetical protein